MASYFLAPSLEKFRSEINAEFPGRDKTSDGWIGDASHAARVSGHNPCWTCDGNLHGIVRAIDVDSNGAPGQRTPVVDQVLKSAIGDHRIWYVIWNKVIYSRTYNWAPRVYSGINPHDHHVHVEIMPTEVAAYDTTKWIGPKVADIARKIYLPNVQHQFRIAIGVDPGPLTDMPGVRKIKRALRADYGFRLSDNGLVGQLAVHAWTYHEARVGGTGRTRVPDYKSLVALSKGRWRVET